MNDKNEQQPMHVKRKAYFQRRRAYPPVTRADARQVPVPYDRVIIKEIPVPYEVEKLVEKVGAPLSPGRVRLVREGGRDVSG